jgi:putative CocE/NonD family hydrolase
MGANEWHAADEWPPPQSHPEDLYLAGDNQLTPHPPTQDSEPDVFTYDPADPTPTVGGSIISYAYTPGSCDVSDVQQRSDVLTYTTEALEHDVDVVGPIRLVFYASSSATDTDFAARLTDVFPDGRAIQLQNGVLRTRYRDPAGDAQLLEPRHIYRFDIDMWATANRFRAGHRIRLDISSADFPRFDRNTNRGGVPGPPVPALQTIYHDPSRPSHLSISVLDTRAKRRASSSPTLAAPVR